MGGAFGATLGVLVVASGAGAARATATVRAPGLVAIDAHFRVDASGLTPARYGLFIGRIYPQRKGARAVVCQARIGALQRSSGAATFAGTLPARLRCSRGPQALGTRRLLPGHYQFLVASPLGPGVYDGRRSFVKRGVFVTPPQVSQGGSPI